MFYIIGYTFIYYCLQLYTPNENNMRMCFFMRILSSPPGADVFCSDDTISAELLFSRPDRLISQVITFFIYDFYPH